MAVLFSLALSSPGTAQSVIINELSNGPSGTKEYVELLVIDTTSTDPCIPPCIDLRGWVIDDNNGYHGAGGIAPGAARFSMDALWSCVPSGTLIVIYNNADPNPALPPDDISLSDGNCSVVVPLNDLAYFEFTNTAPGAVLCDYPAMGWGTDPTPTWSSNTALANTGDCSRLADLSGCEVFSVCYGNTVQNPYIAFAGSGAGNVWFFNSGDPLLQSNWTEGCAGGGCGSDEQTPGTPNNAANAAYIAQLNNNCAPIVPLVASAVATAGCGCDGSVIASGSGSIAPYSFQWFDGVWNNLGGSTSTITGLCPGPYAVVVTSASGCSDTALVVLQQPPSMNAGSGATVDLCTSDPSLDLYTLLGGSPDPGGSWYPTLFSGTGLFDPAIDVQGVHTYIVTALGFCPDTALVTVTVTSTLADAAISAIPVQCTNGLPFGLSAAQTGGTWSGPGIADPVLGIFDPSLVGAGPSQVIYTIAGNCGDADTAFVQVEVPANATIVQPPTLCINSAPVALSALYPGGTWGGPGIVDPAAGLFDPSVTGDGMFSIYYDMGGNCPASDTVEVTVLPQTVPAIASAGPFCANGPPITLTAVPSGGTWSGMGIINASLGLFDPSLVGADSSLITYAVNGPCSGSTTTWIMLYPPPEATILVSDTLGCPPLFVHLEAGGATPGSSFAWDPGDGTGSQTGAAIDHTYMLTGCSSPTLTMTDGNGCVAVLTVPSEICVIPQPQAVFDHHPDEPTASDPLVELINYSIDATAFLWSVDGVFFSTDADAEYHFDGGTETLRVICLIATNGPGCADTTCAAIGMVNDPVLYLPNAFSPNSDGINDRFGALWTGPLPTRFELQVFDRWGELIFRTTDPQSTWDGTHLGVQVPQEVYVWRIDHGQTSGANGALSGQVTLLR